MPRRPSLPSRSAWRAPATGALIGLAAAGAAVALRGRWPGASWVHEPLHSALEAAGAAVALGLAGLLEVRRRVTGIDAAHLRWLAASLIVMGTLDAAHACTRVGPAFFWSRALPTLLGGLLAAGMWRAARPDAAASGARVPAVAAVVAIVLALALLAAPDAWPTAFGPDRVYTTWARLLNVAGGIGFLTGAAFLLRPALHASPSRLAPGAREAAVLAAQLVLFGVAGLLFWLSDVWSPVWWLFHVLRFGAYAVALASGAEVYRRIEETQRGHLERELALQAAELDELRAQLRRTTALEPRP